MAIFRGVVVAVLVLLFVGTGVWLATITDNFFNAFLVLGVVIGLAIIGGFFTAPGSSVTGFITRWRTEWRRAYPPPVNETEVMRNTRWTRDAFLLIAMTGLAAIFIYSLQWQPPGFARIFGSGLMIAVAAMTVGICLGFLFGIPRSLQGVQAPPAAGAAAAGSTPATIGVNTNLEQISDWLTKIIIGLGLINLDKLPAKIDTLLVRLAPSLANDKGFVLAVVTGYGICGFMLGYLLTRLYLTRAFALADRASSEEIGLRVERTGEQKALDPTATAAERMDQSAPAPDTVAKAPVSDNERAAAQDVAQLAKSENLEQRRERVVELAREYDSVRASMTASDERTRRLEVVASKMRALSLACYDLLPVLAASPSAGHRLAAVSFLEVKPNPEYLDWLADRVAKEKPFIGYHAAWALRYAIESLPPSELPNVKKAIDSALASPGTAKGSDRERILQEALKKVSARLSGAPLADTSDMPTPTA